MSDQEELISGSNWSVHLDKKTFKLICSFDNGSSDIDMSESDGMIGYCEDCGQFFDVRAGCETDIRADERDKIKRHIDSLGHKDVAGDIEDMGK